MNILFRRVSLLVGLTLMLQGCLLDDPSPRRRYEGEQPNVVAVTYLDATTAQCACREVEATTARVMLQNLNAERPARAIYEVTTRDLQSGGTINTSVPIQVDPDLNKGELRQINCTVTADRAIPANATRDQMRGICRIRNEYRIVSSVLVGAGRAFYTDKIAGFGAADPTGPAYCRAQCEDPDNPNCLDLGSRHARLAAPFMTLMDAAQTSNRNVIPIAEAYRSMGVSDTEGLCKRGDFVIAGDSITNSGENRCVIERTSVANLFTNATNAEKFALLNGPFDARVELERDVKMTRFQTLAATKGFSGKFEDSDKSIYLGFSQAPFAKGLDKEISGLNEMFAGYVRDIGYGVRRSDGSRILILSTPRGCISMDAPS